MLSTLAMVASLVLADSAARTQRVPAADIEQVVRSAMIQRLQAIGSAANVRVTGRVGDQWLPTGELTIEAGEVAGRLPRSRVGVSVNLKVGGRVVRSLTAWVEMQDPRTVMAYAANYVAHQPGVSVEWAPASVDMACCAGDVATSAEQLVGLRTVRTVRAGRPVMLADFEPQPDVQARQRVAIEVVIGSVRLQTNGVAMADGRIGDRLVVRPDYSRETVRSRVVSKQKVVVDE